LARDVENTVINHQHEFASHVETLLAGNPPVLIAMTFDVRLQTNWPLAEVGFVVAPSGQLTCPSAFNVSPAAKSFLALNGQFLANRESAEVYWNAGNNLKLMDNGANAARNNDNPAQVAVANNTVEFTKNTPQKGLVQR